MDKVKGFNKLTPEQQAQFIRTHQRHQSSVGNDYKEGWTPVSVKPLALQRKVYWFFDNFIYRTMLD